MKLSTVVVTGLLAASVAGSALAVRGNVPMDPRWQTPERGMPSLPSAKVNVPVATAGAMSSAERAQLTAQLVKRWGGYVQQAYGTDPKVWANSLADAFATADPDNLRHAAMRTTYEGALRELVGQGQKMSDQQVIDSLAQMTPSSSASTMETLGSAAGDLVYTMITPCRIFDTRLDTRVGSGVGGVIPVGGTHHFEVSVTGGATFAPQGGGAGACGIPASPSAVVMNVTVLNPLGGGYITVFPYGVARPAAASLNYPSKDSKVGNEIIAKATIGSLYDISIYSANQTDVVGDAVGYFMAPVATAVDCTSVPAEGTASANQDSIVAYPACAATYTRTGGYCIGAAAKSTGFLIETGEVGCVFRNTGTATFQINAVSRCCRVPGR